MMILFTTLAGAQVPADLPRIDVQLYRPPTVAQRTLWTRDATRMPHRYWSSGITFHYARDPFVWVGEDGTVTRVVGDLLTASLHGGGQLGPVWLGAQAPVLLRAGTHEGGESGIGDVTLEARSTLVDHEQAPLGVALLASLSLPTASVGTTLGDGGLGYELGAIVDRPIGAGLVTAELGLHGNPDRDLGALTWSDRLYLRVGGGLPVTDRVTASVDLAGAYNLGGNQKGAGLPVEVLAGGGYRLTDLITVNAGVGTGLTTGIGAPVLRGTTSLRFQPVLTRDADGDGIVDAEDRCRQEPEDVDGVEDADGCPDATRVFVRVEDRNGDLVGSARWRMDGPEGVESAEGRSGDVVERFPGAFGLSAQADGYRPNDTRIRVRAGGPQDVVITLDRIVQPGRVSVTVADEDGRPVEGASWRFVGARGDRFDSGEEVTRPPGSYRVRVDAPGFRPQILPFELAEKGEFVGAVRLKVARVVLEGDQITIQDSIYFETGKAVIKPESHDLLNELAQTLEDHPELLRIRIEGHTDSRGSAVANKDLSARRAEAVQVYLVGRNIEPGRLDAIGFGEERPLMRGNDEEAWARNRRVDFFIVERAPRTVVPSP
jgi:outer membrane protein OmpA-like peptidoglycan-associated protein